MKKIINYAERLHNKINDVFSDLVLTRATDDASNEVRAMLRMEKLMGETLTLLRHIIDNKDNMVDLGEVWHTLDLKSKSNVDIAYLDIVAIVDNEILREITTLNSLSNWLRYNSVVEGQIKWAFWKDLLPKSQNSKQQK